MDALRIERLRTRYRLPAAACDVAARLDRVFAHEVEPMLASTLDRRGLGRHEEICLREVDVFARLRVAEGDAALALAWSDTVAAAIEDAARGDGVVRYASRHHAMVDLLVSVARDDLSRVWAWRQLGLWNSDDPAGTAACAEALHGLSREPEAAATIVAAAAARGALGTLLARAPTASWAALAAAARTAVEGAEPPPLAPSAPANEASSRSERVVVAAAVERVRRASAILRAVGGDAVPPGTLRALAVLATLEVEPALMREPVRGAAVVDALVESLATDATARPAVERYEPGTTGGEVVAAPDDSTLVATSLPDVRSRGVTRAGGLPLLLHLVRELDLPAVIASDPLLGVRSLRFVLHRLALRLVPVDKRDAAVLAFAGLAPDAEPPADEPALGADDARAETAALAILRTRLLTALRARLRRDDESDDRLLAFVCDRTAEIVADPGWIEVRYRLCDVATEVRRAGLDLDPGWLPCLGVVVRFVYV